jgi:hypothetical protein
MIPTVRFKLTTSQPIERFPNLSPAVYAHTVVIWDGDEASFYCEQHDVYFKEKESCPQCNPERQSGSKSRSRLLGKVCEIVNHLRRKS